MFACKSDGNIYGNVKCTEYIESKKLNAVTQ